MHIYVYIYIYGIDMHYTGHYQLFDDNQFDPSCPSYLHSFNELKHGELPYSFCKKPWTR